MIYMKNAPCTLKRNVYHAAVGWSILQMSIRFYSCHILYLLIFYTVFFYNSYCSLFTINKYCHQYCQFYIFWSSCYYIYFIIVEIHWVYWIYRYLFFIKLGQFNQYLFKYSYCFFLSLPSLLETFSLNMTGHLNSAHLPYCISFLVLWFSTWRMSYVHSKGMPLIS